MKYILFCLLAFLFLIVEIFCIKMVPVLTATFPLENTDAVMFTLAQNIDGSRDFVISLIMGVIERSIAICFFLLILIAVILLAVRFLHKRICFKFLTCLTFNRLIVTLNVICFVILAKGIYSDIPVIDYYVKWKDSLVTPDRSDFYIKEYVDPDSVHIEFKEKKNLILIFLESMEYNFQDSANGGNQSRNIIPEITEYLKNEQSFVPGGTQVAGMGWTMADAVAKTCGIPLMFPPSIAGSFKPVKDFIPGARCLTDILAENGYDVLVSKGANLKFSGMDDFLNTHSTRQSFGFIEYSKDKLRIKGNVISEWGVKDSMHFELVKEHIDRISKQEKPWAVWFFTVNTHTPHGIIDSTCGISEEISEMDRLPAIIKCSSHQIDSFIRWAKTQKWFDNTLIAVMGDHAMMAAPELVGFKDENLTHYWLDFFINSNRSAENYSRKFTSLDMFPTILEAMGAEIPNGALGLGRSLYSSSPTLLERYGLDSINRALNKRSVEYDYFLFFKKKRR